MPYHHHSEGTLTASRTRQKPPTARELAAATAYRGFRLIYRGGEIHVWEPDGLYGPRWFAPCHTLAEARAVVNQMLGGAA